MFSSSKTFVTVTSAVQGASVDATRIRSYTTPKGEAETLPHDHKWTVFQVIRAATASKQYFTPLEIPKGGSFSDAGTSGFSNPSKVALEEMNIRFPDHSVVLVSLGTGLSSLLPPKPLKKEKNKEAKEAKEHVDAEENKKKVAGSILKRIKHRLKDKEHEEANAILLAKQMIDVATDAEITHLETATRYKREYVNSVFSLACLFLMSIFRRGRRQDYYRFNPTRGLGDLDIADYMKAALVEEITSVWTKSPEGKAPTLAAANALQVCGTDIDIQFPCL